MDQNIDRRLKDIDDVLRHLSRGGLTDSEQHITTNLLISDLEFCLALIRKLTAKKPSVDDSSI